MWPICAESAVKPQPTNQPLSQKALTTGLFGEVVLEYRKGLFFETQYYYYLLLFCCNYYYCIIVVITVQCLS